METVKFSDKALSVYPMAFYFSAVEAFLHRIEVVDYGVERFVGMRNEYVVLFKAFDKAYKRSQKSALTDQIRDLDQERDHYALVMQRVAELWGEKLDDESLAVHGRRVAQVFRDYSFRTSEALVAENAKVYNMEQVFSDRQLTADLQMMGLTELNRRLENRTGQIEQLMSQRNEERSDVVVGELKAARESLDLHYRAFLTYLNAVQELEPVDALSQAAQYYNADLAKIDLQYQQSRKRGGKDDPEPEPEPDDTQDHA